MENILRLFEIIQKIEGGAGYGKMYVLRKGRYVRQQRFSLQPQNQQNLEAQHQKGQRRCGRNSQNRHGLLALSACRQGRKSLILEFETGRMSSPFQMERTFAFFGVDLLG